MTTQIENEEDATLVATRASLYAACLAIELGYRANDPEAYEDYPSAEEVADQHCARLWCALGGPIKIES